MHRKYNIINNSRSILLDTYTCNDDQNDRRTCCKICNAWIFLQLGHRTTNTVWWVHWGPMYILARQFRMKTILDRKDPSSWQDIHNTLKTMPTSKTPLNKEWTLPTEEGDGPVFRRYLVEELQRLVRWGSYLQERRRSLAIERGAQMEVRSQR